MLEADHLGRKSLDSRFLATLGMTSIERARALRALSRAVGAQRQITRSPDLSRPAVDHPMEKGFTLIEMIIVVAIILILASIAIPAYRLHVLHSREAVLKEDLYSMRQCIDQYTQDKNKAPQNLDDLVSAGYLKAIPKDPFTSASDTWQPVSDDSIQQLGQTDTGIVDVHSGSNMVASDGTAYNTW